MIHNFGHCTKSGPSPGLLNTNILESESTVPPDFVQILGIRNENGTLMERNLVAGADALPTMAKQCFFFVHLPWGKSSGVSFGPIDGSRLERMRSRRKFGIVRMPHFTLTPDGVRRFLAYFPILTIEKLEQHFFETYQDIPITLTRGQIVRLAGQVGFRGRKPGFLLPPVGDVYEGLPIEMLPGAEVPEVVRESSAASCLDPPPLFPTSGQMRLMAAVMAISTESRSGENCTRAR